MSKIFRTEEELKQVYKMWLLGARFEARRYGHGDARPVTDHWMKHTTVYYRDGKPAYSMELAINHWRDTFEFRLIEDEQHAN